MSTTNQIAASAGIGATDGSAVQTTSGNSVLGKDDFLKLLMAQMGNQDPTAPTDNSAFVAQLAQFSSLEAQQTTNTDLESLLVAQASANQTAMTNYVGKDVDYTTNHLGLTAGGSAVTAATLAGQATSITAIIADGQGNVVRTLELGAHDAGAVNVVWDGRDDKGNTMPAGDYSISVTAKNAAGASVVVDQTGTGHVSGLSFEAGVASLDLDNGTTIKLSDIQKIKERTTP